MLADIRQEPGHADIRDIDIAVFAALYLHALHWSGRIRESAITTVVNRLADDHDDGVLDLLLEDLAQGDDAANAARVDAWVRRREQLDLLFSRGD